MVKKIIISGAVLFATLFIFFNPAFAQGNPFNLKFPISELGNCSSYDSCKSYCDDATHTRACLAFGENHGLISKSETSQIQNFSKFLKAGDVPVPGCTDESTCRAQCEIPENQLACYKWAQAHGFAKVNVPSGNVQKVNHGFDKDKALKIISQSSGPGGCKNEQECSNFCSTTDNQKICIKWAQDNGLISAENAKRSEKLASFTGPGGCKGEECKTYCDDPDNQEECIKFAKDNGFISQDDADRLEKRLHVTQDIQTQGGPGGCKNEDECKQYCSDPNNVKECNEFAVKSGFITQDEASQRMKEFDKNTDEPLQPQLSPESSNNENDSQNGNNSTDNNFQGDNTPPSDQNQSEEQQNQSPSEVEQPQNQPLVQPQQPLEQTPTPHQPTSNNQHNNTDCYDTASCQAYCLTHTTETRCIDFLKWQNQQPSNQTPSPTTQPAPPAQTISPTPSTYYNTQQMTQPNSGCYDTLSCQSYCSTHATESNCAAFLQSQHTPTSPHSFLPYSPFGAILDFFLGR